LGHALERATEFALRYGEGAAIGTVLAGRLAGALGRIDQARVAEHLEVICGYGLPTGLPARLQVTELIGLTRLDKAAGQEGDPWADLRSGRPEGSGAGDQGAGADGRRRPRGHAPPGMAAANFGIPR
jgi:5-deoxy-5-amino-3-dehydroquinate synthase